jgi:hypothetical protein
MLQSEDGAELIFEFQGWRLRIHEMNTPICTIFDFVVTHHTPVRVKQHIFRSQPVID